MAHQMLAHQEIKKWDMLTVLLLQLAFSFVLHLERQSPGQHIDLAQWQQSPPSVKLNGSNVIPPKCGAIALFVRDLEVSFVQIKIYCLAL